MKKIRFVFLSALLGILLFAAAAPALAHANLVRSDPPANSAQKVPPQIVRAWFSEAVEPSFSSLAVLDKNGVRVDKGDSQRMSDDPTGLQVSLNDLPEGLYTVVWQTESAVDGHVVNGSFAFTVGDTPLTESSPRELMSQVDTTLAANTPPPLGQVIVRWLNILALALLVGALAFPIFIWPMPSVRARAFVRVAFVLAVLATLAMLVMQTLITGAGIGAIGRVLLETRFGMVWIFRALILVALGVMLFRASDGVKRRGWNWLLFALGIALLFTQSLDSHDAAVIDPPLLPLLTDSVHLLGAAIWVGGLAQLLFVAPVYLSTLTEDEQPRALSSLITRFSLVAFITVGVVGATGLYSMYLQVGSLEALFNTLYGTALLVKLLLIFILLAVAGLNLIVMRPASARVAAARVRAFARRFDVAVAVEILLAFGVLLVVGVMTSAEPGKSAYNPSPNLQIETQRADDLYVTLGIAPAVVGANDFDIKVRDASGQPVSNATVVRLSTSMREMDMGTQELDATNQGNGHYTLHAEAASMVGTWNFQVLVRRAGVDDVRTTFEFLALAQPATPQPPLILSSTEAQIGMGLALLALAVGAASAVFLRNRWRRLANLGAAVVIGMIGALAVLEATANGPAIPGVIVPIAPPSARLLHSPIAPTSNQIAAGQQIYQQNCAVCHGADGKGDGPAAVNLNPKPFDLTVHAPMHTEGELYWWVTNGIAGTAMPVWGNRLTDLQRWQVVTFIKTFGASATPTPVASSLNFVAQPAPDVQVSLAVTGNRQFDAQVNVPANVIFEFTALDTNEDVERIDAANANGHYTANGNYLDAPGLWGIRVVVQRTGQADAIATFPYYVAGKNDTNDPTAVEWLKQADAAMNALKSLRSTEQLNDGSGGSAITDYEFQAPDRMRYQVRGGAESIAVGPQQFDRDGNAWSTRARVDAYVFPNFTNAQNAKAARLGRAEDLNGIPTQIVEMVDANSIRYAFWIGTNDHLIRQYAMIGPGHLMMEYYSDYNAPANIQAPGTPVVQRQQVNGLDIALSATPRAAGVSDWDVTLADANGRPVDNAARVMLLSAPTNQPQSANSFDAANGGNGHYRVSGPWLYRGGNWQIGVVVQLADQSIRTAVLTLDVTEDATSVESSAVEDSPSPMHPINVTVYDSRVTVSRTDLPPGQIVRVTAMRMAGGKNDCGGHMEIPQLGLSTPFSAAGIAELKFIAPYWGELHAVCGKDGLVITL